MMSPFPPLVRRAVRALSLSILLLAPATLVAQPDDDDPRVKVFLDCPTGGCDRNFLITEHPYAVFTQDRLDADIHLLVTRQATGSGGGEYTLQFIGQRRFQGRVDTLVTNVPPNVSEDMRRRNLSRMVHVGLVSRVARGAEGARLAERLLIAYDPMVGGTPTPVRAPQDRWNLWVYRVRLNGNAESESRSGEYELSGSLSANRITEDWKFEFNADNEYNARRFELSDGSERRFILRSARATSRIVRSLSEHWSIGSRVRAGLNEFQNQDAYANVDLSAEYNFFPWREATSRQFVGIVSLGGQFNDYREITIFEQSSETRPTARFVIAGESRQAWGQIDAALRYTQFLHDMDRYNVSFNGRSTLRLSRGLSLELSAEAAKVQDQLFLPRGDATDDEVLTRQRALATAYRLRGSVGLSFTFGSIFNTFVNPRLNELGG
jgi:hypothetical protein